MIRHPDDLALNSQLETAILQMRDLSRPANTAKAIDPKMEEYFQFCDAIYPNDQYGYCLVYEKVYRFMWYQVFREQKPRGGKRSQLQNGMRFDKEKYEELMDRFRECCNSGSDCWPVPKNPTGKSVFTAYKNVFRVIHKAQTAARVTGLHWDQIWLSNFDELQKHVKERAPLAKRATYQEKVAGEFSPYTVVEHYEDIEELLWHDSAEAVGKRAGCAMLRHRYCLLHLSSGVLRCESLYRAELSDFLGLRPPRQETDVHPVYVMINQVAIGKTNHGRLLYGRALRHRNAKLCCIGALSMYLQCRFWITDEFANFTTEDWTNNSKWFDIKLLVDVNGADNTVSMKNDSYSKHIKRVLIKLNIVCDKLLHLGRNLGAKTLDLLEEETAEIKRMGQWDPSTFDNAYSSKLPMGPMRKLAGFAGSHKIHFNTRTTVKPGDVLLRATPIGKWVYEALDGVLEVSDNGDNCTAIAVLRFFADLNECFLQDCAAMLVTAENSRMEHFLFEEMPVFDLPEWDAFVTEMKNALENEANPLDANLEAVLPGVHQWHQVNQSGMQALGNKIDSLSSNVQQSLVNVAGNMERQQEESDKRLASSFLAIARQLLATSPSRSRKNTDEDFNYDLHLAGDIDGAARMSKLPPMPTANSFESPTKEQGQHQTKRNTSDGGLKFRMKARHASLSDLWAEWHGEEPFYDELGGIKGRDKRDGAKWRKHLDAQHYSRCKRIVAGIHNFAAQQEISTTEATAVLETAFENNSKSPANFVVYLQAKGLLAKKKARGKKRESTNSSSSSDADSTTTPEA